MAQTTRDAERTLEDFEYRVREVRDRLVEEWRALTGLLGEAHDLACGFDRTSPWALRLDGVRDDVDMARDAVRLAYRMLDDVGI